MPGMYPNFGANQEMGPRRTYSPLQGLLDDGIAMQSSESILMDRMNNARPSYEGAMKPTQSYDEQMQQRMKRQQGQLGWPNTPGFGSNML